MKPEYEILTYFLVGQQYMPPIQIKKTPRNIWESLKVAWRFYYTAIRRQAYAQETFAVLKNGGWLDERSTFGFMNPTIHIGTAIELAQRHGVNLSRGSSYGTIRATKGKAWVERPDLCLAVCDCLLAHREGQYGVWAKDGPRIHETLAGEEDGREG